MISTSSRVISAPVAQAIEDAVLFGHIKEIDAVLDLIEDDDAFPEELRYGLESLRYFREYYGRDGASQPTQWLQRQKVAVMESSWGSSLLELLRHSEDVSIKSA